MNLSSQDRQLLERLRQRFLHAEPIEQSYWQSTRELELYHATFAQRIGWKWQAMLDELGEREWTLPPDACLCDLGCGSGIATEVVLSRFGARAEVVLCDRSALAVEYAAGRLRERFPECQFRTATHWHIPPGSVVLISHVLTELTSDDLAMLADQLRHQARAVLIVEPGTRHASAQVVALRQMLCAHFAIVLPCPHRESCGMTAIGNRLHWCHFHVRPPTEAFTERQWSRFADAFSLDIGDLAVSMLVLDAQWNAPAGGQERIIGAADISPQDVVVTVCSADGCIRRRIVAKRTDPEQYRRLRKRLPRWLD